MALALRFPNAATSNQRRQVIPPSQGAVLDIAVPLRQITGLPGRVHSLPIPLSHLPSLHRLPLQARPARRVPGLHP